MNGPDSVTSWTARAGRSTPCERPSLSTAAAIPAPVWPAVTTASASPRFTRSMATRIDESFFSRSASAGASSMPTTWLAATNRTFDGIRAPAIAWMRAHVPDEDHLVERIGSGVRQRAWNDFLRPVVAAHGVHGDAYRAPLIGCAD